MKNSMDFNLPNVTDQDRQESIVKHDKDELKDVQACSDIALDDNVEK